MGEANDHPRAAELVRRGNEPAYNVVGRIPPHSLGEELAVVRIRAEFTFLGLVRSAPHSTEQEQVEHAVREGAPSRDAMCGVDGLRECPCPTDVASPHVYWAAAREINLPMPCRQPWRARSLREVWS